MRPAGPIRVSFLALLAALAVAAPVLAARGGPDAFGYTWVDSDEPDGPPLEDFEFDSFDWYGGGPDWLSPAVPLPFTFFFYERGYDDIYISDNGWASFLPQTDPYPVPTMMPQAGQGPGAFVAPLWTDLSIILLYYGPILDGRGYKIYWGGHAPSRLAMDVILYLFPDGRIRINYIRARKDNFNAVGIEDHTETDGITLQYLDQAFDGFNVFNGYAVEFIPPQDLACGSAVPVSCGERIRSGPPSVPPDPDARVYCSSGSYKAAETVFELELDRPLDVSAAISGFDPRDPDLFLLDGCREMDCVAGGDDRLLYEAPRAGTYYLAVDGPDPADEGPFDLTVECTDPYLPVVCGEGVAGSTAGRRSRRDEHACPFLAGDYSGADAQYVVCLPVEETLRLELDTTADLDLIVYRDNVGPESCVDWGDNAVTLFGAAEGCYYVFVDGPSAAGGDFRLNTSCSSRLDCTAAAPLECGATVTGDTGSTGPGRVEIYPCSGEVFDGPEALFSFVNPRRQNVSLLLEGAPPGVDLLLARECDEGFCFDAADETMHQTDLEAGRYSLFVDGRNGEAGAFSLTAICGPSLSPEAIDITLDPGGLFPEEKLVYLTPDIPLTEIMVVVDSTSSMREELPNIKGHILKIIDGILLLQDDVRFGVINFEDYYQSYAGQDNCGYEADFGGYYGWMYDQPYILHQPLTEDIGLFEAKVGTVRDQWGRDGKSSYSRALWETVHDENIGWTPGSRRFLLTFGDALPHDCDLDACVPGGLPLPEPSTGKDPGRDEMINTADDLAILDVIDELADDANDHVILYFDSSGVPEQQALWECWAEKTGGGMYVLDTNGDPVPPLDLGDVVLEMIADRMTRCGTLTLSPSAGYEDWLVTIVPPQRTDVLLPAATDFQIVLSPPVGTPAGLYRFTMDLHCDGVLLAQQDVAIRVGACSLAVAASADPETACQGTPISLDAATIFAEACDGEIQYRWLLDGTVIRDFDPAPSATGIIGPGASTYTVEMACIGGSFCTGSSSSSIDVFAVPDAVPPPLGASLRVARSGGLDLMLDWTDLPLPDILVGEYEVLAMAGDRAPAPPELEDAPVVATAPRGAGQAVHTGAQPYRCGTSSDTLPCLRYYKVRATSYCTSTPGPACNGFPAQVPCP